MDRYENKVVSLALLALLILPLTYVVKQRVELSNEPINSSLNQQKETNVLSNPQPSKASMLMEEGLQYYHSKDYKKSITYLGRYR